MKTKLALVTFIIAGSLGFEATNLGNASPCVPTPTGLIGWWPGDGDANDLAENNNGVPSNLGYGSGMVGQAFQFGGTDSYLGVSNQAVFNAITNITFECWVRNNQLKLQRYLTLTPDWVRLGMDEAPGRAVFSVALNSGQLAVIRDPTPMTSGVWYHLAGTYDGRVVRLYANGKLVAAQGAPGGTENHGAAPGVIISYFGDPRGQGMDGLLDEAALYSRALSDEEIQAHFAAGSAGMCRLRPILVSGRFSFLFGYRFRIKGEAQTTYGLEASTDLIQWTPLFSLGLTDSPVTYTDLTATNFPVLRFYRKIRKP